ncbi:MAG TPA: DUF4126 domain-containing protein [Dermatophilaceae bacterium]|nr:DUF4126 domain-containing protein [Dermatophilaceae bacterium]
MGAELLPWAFTSGWASGINAYAVVLVMGLIGRFGEVAAVPSALTRTDVLMAAGVLFLVEMVADKIPYLDSMWDTVHTVVRPTVGATLGYLLGHDAAGLETAFATATGGVTALASHAVKSGIRLGVNASPEPASNVLVSTGEDVLVAGVISLLAARPWLAAGVAAVLLVVGLLVAMILLSRLRRFKQRYDDWGTRKLAGLRPRRTARTTRPPTLPPAP